MSPTLALPHEGLSSQQSLTQKLQMLCKHVTLHHQGLLLPPSTPDPVILHSLNSNYYGFLAWTLLSRKWPLAESPTSPSDFMCRWVLAFWSRFSG